MSYEVLPYNDFFVRYLLGDESNTDILISFINAVHEDHELPLICSVTIKNPFNLKTLKDEKESIIDIKAYDEAGRQYDIEVQVEGNELFKHRSLYYWAKLYTSQIKSGMDYRMLKPTICINLINFNLIAEEREQYHSCFMLRELKKPQLILTDHQIIHYLELPKFLKSAEFRTALDKWLAFFKYEGKDENIMKTIINDPIIHKAHERYTSFSQNDELLEIYEARMKWQMQYNADIGYTVEKTKKETAKNMLQDGVPLEKIMLYTGLEEEVIRKLNV